MAFKDLLKSIAETYSIPKDEVRNLQDAVTGTIDERVAETTKHLSEQIAGFKTEKENETLKSLGYSEKQIKILNKVITRDDKTKFEDAVKAASEEYDIKPTEVEESKPKPEVKNLDDTKPPLKKTNPSMNDGSQDDEEGGVSDIIL